MATAPPRTVSRLQSGVATDWEILLRPDVGEGRNTMLRRGWCGRLVFESVQNRFGSLRGAMSGVRGSIAGARNGACRVVLQLRAI